MPHLEVPADVLSAVRLAPRSWEILPTLAEWFLDARTGRVEVDCAALEALDALTDPPATDRVPDEVLLALAKVPGLWPVALELARWVEDARTGRIEVEVVDGQSRELRRVERAGPVQRMERLVLGRGLNLPDGARPVCPICGDGGLHDIDYGNRYFCPPCDRLWTVWELKRHNAFQVPARG